LKIDTDEIQGLPAGGDIHVDSTQDSDAALAEEFSNRILDSRPGIVVPQAAVHPEGRSQPAQGIYHGVLCTGVKCYEIAGQNDHVGLLGVRNGDILPDLLGRHKRADMDIGELADSKALKSTGQTRQPDYRRGGFQVQSPVKQAIRACYEGRSGGDGSGSFHKPPSGRRLDV
jgi:hypothetical protein